MVYVHADDKSRVSLTKEIVDRYGRDFIIVPSKDEILLIPVPEDAIKALQEEGKKIPKSLSMSDLKKMIRQEVEKEVL